MTKRKDSVSASISRSKRAKAQPKNRSPSPGPSRTGYQHIQPDPPIPMEDVATEDSGDDPTATNPGFPSPELLSIIAQEMEVITDGDALIIIPSFGEYTSKTPLFLKILSPLALEEKDWKDVVMHDVFWTELTTDSKPRFLPDSREMLIPRTLSEQGKSQKLRRGSVPECRFGCLAAERSWTAEFVDEAALEGLGRHVSQQMAKMENYAPFCSIVQSSGMGKSRLLDEFSKDHFLIPINLREEGSRGFPPPDVVVRNFLTPYDSEDKNMQEKSYSRACHFLLELFVCTKDTITSLGADNQKDRIAKKFRDFMSEDQRFSGVGTKRKEFYAGVVGKAQKAIHDRAEAPSEDELLAAFERLRECVYKPLEGKATTGKPKKTLADVFISFDEAHPLTTPWDDNNGLSNCIELQRVLHLFSENSLFAFFLSTNGKISQFVPPRTRDPSDRIFQGSFSTPRPFVELGFDQLMWNRKILDEYKTLEQVTSSECIAHMGRPLWGTMYDHGGKKVRKNLLSFAIQKLLGSPIVSADTIHKREQFDLANALQDVLTGYSIHSGDRGELLVAAFFTWARDAVMLEQPPPRPEFCHHFSVEELFSCLFSEEIVESIFNHTPSISPLKSKQRTFGEVASSANMHFNHFIRPQEQKLISRQYLLAFIARGAAVLGANCQPGFDAVFPYLYGSTDLDDKNVGFVIVQVKNDSKFSQPIAELFRKIDPFECGLLDEADFDKSNRFPIPVIRIVFALRGKQSTVTPMSYSSPSEGACSSRFDERGEPRFTSYDYWCSGIGPDFLQPVGKADWKWEALLDLPDEWSSLYNRSLAPNVLRSHFPASSHDKSHLDRWLSDSWIFARS
ncbi:hypothetical protein BJV78DRAFT_1359880 [Lactifluus subvellereus]|nr:hypothetical protein BJV78DRAFT_1359880 [Lactifluus subvellereus]